VDRELQQTDQAPISSFRFGSTCIAVLADVRLHGHLAREGELCTTYLHRWTMKNSLKVVITNPSHVPIVVGGIPKPRFDLMTVRGPSEDKV